MSAVDAFVSLADTMQRMAQKYADGDAVLGEKMLQMERELSQHTP